MKTILTLCVLILTVGVSFIALDTMATSKSRMEAQSSYYNELQVALAEEATAAQGVASIRANKEVIIDRLTFVNEQAAYARNMRKYEEIKDKVSDTKERTKKIYLSSLEYVSNLFD